MTSEEYLSWLDANTSRLMDVYWHIENEGGDIRSAIDNLSDEKEKS